MLATAQVCPAFQGINKTSGSAASKVLAVSLDILLSGMVCAGLTLDALCSYLALTRETLFVELVRLGLPTPPDIPLRKPAARGWTIQEIQRLIAWRSSGVHPEAIGEHLSRPRSANAVRAKARRLGLPVPPRKSLFRPTREQLLLPLSLEASVRAPSRQPLEKRTPPSAVVGDQGLLRLTPKPVPTTVEELDLADLTWIGGLRGRRGRPGAAMDGITTNRAAVYAVGLITCAGVDRHVAAALLGLSVPAYRTLRTRLGVPPVANKTAFTGVFDREVGEETIKRSGLEIVASIKRGDDRPPLFFWRFSDERQVRLAPHERLRRSRGEVGFAKPVTIVTRAVLDAETRNCGRKPARYPTVAQSNATGTVRERRPIVQAVVPRSKKAPFVPPVPASSTSFATVNASVGL